MCVTTGKHEHAQLQRHTSSATQIEERSMPTTKCIMLPLLLLLLLHDGVCRCEECHSLKVFERMFFTILNGKRNNVTNLITVSLTKNRRQNERRDEM